MKLIHNISYSLGLVVGAFGTVYKFSYPKVDSTSDSLLLPNASLTQCIDAIKKGKRLLLPIVLVEMDKEFYKGKSCVSDRERIVPISPVALTMSWHSGSVTRTQLPFIVAFANTIHSFQGATMKIIVVDPERCNFTPGLMYVALSRVTSFAGLVLTKRLTRDMFSKEKSERDRMLEEEMKRLRSLVVLTKQRLNSHQFDCDK